jgi:hypothetical protein
MNMEFAPIIEAKKNFVARSVNSELVLVPLNNQVADMTALFNLNEVGQFIWNEIQEGITFDSLVEKIVSAYDVEKDTASEDLQSFLAELSTFLLKE